MFIQVETTPNPATLKFITGTKVLSSGTMQFNNVDETVDKSQFAADLFSIVGVKAVFLGFDFISVTRADGIAWDIIRADILSVIMDYFTKGIPLTKQEILANEGITNTSSDLSDNEGNALIYQIKEILEQKVRPAVAQDGGDIIFHSFKDGIVKLELHGACSGCPSSTATLKNGVENLLKYYVPEVISVEAV